MQDVFEVVEVSYIVGNQWRVRGRAWQTIEVGETVFSAVGRVYKTSIENDKVQSTLFEPEGGPTLYPFKIVLISFYWREVDKLDRGHAGVIVLEGEHGETLLDTKLLVVLEPDEQDQKG
jgi:hypothetical protein